MSDISKEFMTIGEAATLATNLEVLEQIHGGPVPGYMINVDDMSKDFKSIGELGMMSSNLDFIERINGVHRPPAVVAASHARDIATVVFAGIVLILVAIGHFL